MSKDYWSRTLSRRLGRRRALAAAGGATLASAFLAACGGSDKEEGQTSSSSSSDVIAKPEDTTSQAKAGGVVKDYYTAELTDMDALRWNTASTVNLISVFAYPRILKFTIVKAPEANDGDRVEGEAAASYELSPDKLTLTLKLRQGMKWDARAPTNARLLDSQDVLFSWNKFKTQNASAANIAYDAQRSPGAAVETVSAPDAQTVIMKLNKPDPALLTLLAGWDQWYIMPRESDGGFDPRNTIRGHGPWLLEEFVPSSHTNWIKNPEYYNKARPFPDRLERVLVPEYATRLAQFKAGNIHTDVVQFAPQDVVQLHKDLPKTLVFQAATFGPTSSPNVIFGYEGDSPFRDVRLRRAMSMAIDREAFADTIENRADFARDGFDIEVALNTVLSAGWGDFWLDPKNASKFGPSVKYLEHHPDDAKQLLSAAGHGSGLDFDFFFNQEQTYGAAYPVHVQILQGMFQEVGLRAKLNGLPYAQWLNNYHYGYIPANYQAGKVKGFNGIGLAAERTRYTPAFSLYGLMHPSGDAFHGAVREDGTGNAIEGNPKLNEDLAKLRAETDRNKALSLTHDIIKYATDQAIYIPKPSNSKFFTVWWPAISNNFAFNSSTVGPNIWAETRVNWWLDTTKPPFV
jgi:ABC-type transport system substrate-binding protein